MFRIPDFHHNTRVVFFTAAVFLLSTQSLVAHPGHGSAANQTGLLHYLTSPMHMAPGVVLIAVAVAAIRWLSRILRNDSE